MGNILSLEMARKWWYFLFICGQHLIKHFTYLLAPSTDLTIIMNQGMAVWSFVNRPFNGKSRNHWRLVSVTLVIDIKNINLKIDIVAPLIKRHSTRSKMTFLDNFLKLFCPSHERSDGVMEWWSDGVMECGVMECGVMEWPSCERAGWSKLMNWYNRMEYLARVNIINII